MDNPNIYHHQKLRAIRRKYDAIIEKGGCCSSCGYKKNMSALEFHHKDPNEKKFRLDFRYFSNTKIEILKIELDKCELLCSNCHRELHNKTLEMDIIDSLVKNIHKKTFSTPNYKQNCKHCGIGMKSIRGKKFCSDICRNKHKNYPEKCEVLAKYGELKTWVNVASYFGLTKKIIQNIRKK